MKFDNHKFLKLLKEIKRLREEGKSLRDSDKAKRKQFIQYLTLLVAQIFCQIQFAVNLTALKLNYK